MIIVTSGYHKWQTVYLTTLMWPPWWFKRTMETLVYSFERLLWKHCLGVLSMRWQPYGSGYNRVVFGRSTPACLGVTERHGLFDTDSECFISYAIIIFMRHFNERFCFVLRALTSGYKS